MTVPTASPPKKLVTKDLITGTGATATSGTTVTVNYVGVLYKGGKQFDSSWQRNQPFTTALSTGQRDPRLGPGHQWDEGRRTPRADHPAEPRLRREGQPADDPG